MYFEEFIGSVTLFTDAITPENWADCDGTILNVADNQPLHALIGANFGGDGKTTFGLPKIPNVGTARYIICVNGDYPPFP